MLGYVVSFGSDSSVGRALAWKAKGHWFKPNSGQKMFFIYFLAVLFLSELFGTCTFLNLSYFVVIIFTLVLFFTNSNLFVLNKINFFWIKKVLSYLNFNFLRFFKKILSLLKFFKIFQLKWKPLFKKSSYYFLYRTSKNKWLNK